jgi:DNA-binding NarL/FixJ family response regulator
MMQIDSAQNKRIGIVEDNDDMQIMYKRMFRKAKNIEIVLQVPTAEAALEEIPKSNIDLIIIDISLPGMDGITLVRELRMQFPHLKSIIVTGHDREAYESASMEAGADGFVTKGNGVEMVATTCRLLS